MFPDSIFNTQSFEITKENQYVPVALTGDIEIIMSHNEHSVRYEIHNFKPVDNDTMHLVFYEFHAIDTTKYSAGCLDGQHQESQINIEEFNLGSQEIESLPDSIIVKTKSDIMVFKKSVRVSVSINKGRGMKYGEKWGFIESTSYHEVIYTYNHSKE
ncbi:MAG: hypothetical protein GC181_07745 [Bacteroidetes bacterium]|nr:hypothetical protein [Bacteroidota bacterium]